MKTITSNYQNHVLSFDEAGWFNATQASNKFNKSVHEWVRLTDTQKYLDALKRKYGEIPYLKTKRGHSGGTWLHPKLAVRFAQWLDIDFALWCDEQIDHLLRGSHPTIEKMMLRHQSSAVYKAMLRTLQISRERIGKDTKSHHYRNEALLINWALTGQYKKLNRDELSLDDLELLTSLESLNLVLIGSQHSYEERKSALSLHAEKFKAASNGLNQLFEKLVT